MVATNNATASNFYVSAEQLQVGLYIFIDLPWFKHPFTLNSFRIGSAEQVSTLRSLGESRFRYDPERSDILPESPDCAESSVEQFVPQPEACPCEENPELTAAQERIRVLSAHRQRIEQVDKAFLKSSSILRNLNRNLMNKPSETLQEMSFLVDQMVLAFLKHPEVTLHVMSEKCGGDETYSHSLNVSVLCMMLTKGLNFSPEQAQILGLGALLHDIGLRDTLNKSPAQL